MKQQSPMLRLWELGEGQQGGLKQGNREEPFR